MADDFVGDEFAGAVEGGDFGAEDDEGVAAGVGVGVVEGFDVFAAGLGLEDLVADGRVSDVAGGQAFAV